MNNSENTHNISSHHHRSRHSGYTSHKSQKQSNPTVEIAKERKKKIWLRTFFGIVLSIAVLSLIVMIINSSGENNERTGLNPFASVSENDERFLDEIDELKKKNMQLEYELEKYKEKYGELTDSKKD